MDFNNNVIKLRLLLSLIDSSWQKLHNVRFSTYGLGAYLLRTQIGTAP